MQNRKIRVGQSKPRRSTRICRYLFLRSAVGGFRPLTSPEFARRVEPLYTDGGGVSFVAERLAFKL